MSNPFFTNVIDLISGRKARASAVEANFSAVEAGFDGIEARINLKGDIANQAWSGAHSYIGATVRVDTQPPAEDSTKVASTAWARAFTLAQIGLVNATSSLVRQNMTTPTLAATAGNYYEIRTSGADGVLTAPVAPADAQMFGASPMNGRSTNIIDFGASTVRGPIGTGTGQMILENLSPVYFRWNSTFNEWSLA